MRTSTAWRCRRRGPGDTGARGRGAEPMSTQLPDLPALTAGLFAAVGGPVTVTHRERNEMASTFPSEVLTCRFGDGAERRVHAKYEGGDARHTAEGHRGGVG